LPNKPGAARGYADTGGIRKRERNTRALKRLDIETLRQSAPKGRKVVYVWDKAGIDFLQWFKWKHAGGIYFVSRDKIYSRSLNTLF
jgi:hypothetical protein